MPSVLAFSPHLDDAAFSAGGTLAHLVTAGWDAEVATVFTASVREPRGFALACQLDKGLSADVDYMALRRAEDALACAALGVRSTWLPVREAPHRGYDSPAELFGPTRSDDEAEDTLPLILGQVLADRRPDLILAPQAVGGHVDHVQLVSALLSLAPVPPLLWWTDWPYSARPHTHPARPFSSLMAALPEITSHFEPAPKRAACAAYASQIGFQFGGEAGLVRALQGAGAEEHFRVQGEVPALLAETLAHGWRSRVT